MERADHWRASLGLVAVGALLAGILAWNSALSHPDRIIAIIVIGGVVLIVGILNMRATLEEKPRRIFDLSISVGAAIVVALANLSLYVFAGHHGHNLRDAGIFGVLAVANYLVLQQGRRKG